MPHDVGKVLGIYMRIRCPTRSTWKVWDGVAQSAGKTMLCCPPPIRSCQWLSVRSKLLGWWHASHFLSPLSCRLSSFCWAVNHLPYIWTRSGAVFYPPSLCDLKLHAIHVARRRPERHVPKVRKLCIHPYISIVNPLQTEAQQGPTSARRAHTIMSLTL